MGCDSKSKVGLRFFRVHHYQNYRTTPDPTVTIQHRCAHTHKFSSENQLRSQLQKTIHDKNKKSESMSTYFAIIYLHYLFQSGHHYYQELARLINCPSPTDALQWPK